MIGEDSLQVVDSLRNEGEAAGCNTQYEKRQLHPCQTGDDESPGTVSIC